MNIKPSRNGSQALCAHVLPSFSVGVGKAMREVQEKCSRHQDSIQKQCRKCPMLTLLHAKCNHSVPLRSGHKTERRGVHRAKIV